MAKYVLFLSNSRADCSVSTRTVFLSPFLFLGEATLPTIFISFENAITNKKVNYDRGVDSAGNSIVVLKNQANIGPTSGRLGNVLRLSGIDAGAVVGKFVNHPLK